MVSSDGKATLLSGVPTYQQLEQAIVQVSEGAIWPHEAIASPEALATLLVAHPLVSLVEVATAFGLENDREGTALAKPLLEVGRARLVDAPKGRFLAACSSPFASSDAYLRT